MFWRRPKKKRIYPNTKGFWCNPTKSGRVYLDYAASAPMRAQVKKVMTEALNIYANPGTIHQEGVFAKTILEEARQKSAAALFCRANQVVFTGGATESNNLAIMGAVGLWKKENPGKVPHIVVSRIEHPSIIECAKRLEKDGAEVSFVGVDREGTVSLREIKESLKENTVLVSVIWASNEIGTIEPVQEIAKALRHYKKYELKNHESKYPLFHTDASQVPVYEKIDMRSLAVDLLTLAGEKMYGPRGVGLLFVRHKDLIEKVVSGGGQELNLRPGTENISGILGFTKALLLATNEREKESARIKRLQEYCLLQLEEKFPSKFILNGSRTNRLPNNINVTFPNFESELLVIELDARGVAVSEKSACKDDTNRESSILEAIDIEYSEWGSLRVSFGRDTKKKDIDSFVLSLGEIFEKYEKI